MKKERTACQQKGQQAEEQACCYLQHHGLIMVERNYRCRYGEIDLIMQEAHEIIFVEVRSRSRIDYGNAVESIITAKKRKLIKSALHYLQQKNWLYKKNSRFDVVAIHPICGKMQMEWIKDAFTMD